MNTFLQMRWYDPCVLEKRDYRAINGTKLNDVWAQTVDWWQRAGFAIYHVGPGHLTGASYYSKIGLRREIELRLTEHEGSLYVDLSFRARIMDEGAVGGAVTAVLFWPVAAVGGAISWSEYDNEANALIWNYWVFLSQVTGKPLQLPPAYAPPSGVPYAPSPQAQPAPVRRCSKCGTGLATDWKACPNCGQLVT